MPVGSLQRGHATATFEVSSSRAVKSWEDSEKATETSNLCAAGAPSLFRGMCSGEDVARGLDTPPRHNYGGRAQIGGRAEGAEVRGGRPHRVPVRAAPQLPPGQVLERRVFALRAEKVSEYVT